MRMFVKDFECFLCGFKFKMPGHQLFVFYFLVSSLTQRWVIGFSTGPPQSVCDSMEPNHPGVPRTKDAPYSINVSSTIYDRGSRIGVRIYALGGTSLKGFMLKAVNKYDETVGSFEKHSHTLQICPDQQGKYHATGHNDATPKQRVEVVWQAPPTLKGDLAFRATIVQSQSVYWVHQYSQKIVPNITTTSTSTTTTPTTTPTSIDVTTIGPSAEPQTGRPDPGPGPNGVEDHHDHDHGHGSSNTVLPERLLGIISLSLCIVMYSL